MDKFFEIQMDFLRILDEYRVSGDIEKCIFDIGENIERSRKITGGASSASFSERKEETYYDLLEELMKEESPLDRKYGSPISRDSLGGGGASSASSSSSNEEDSQEDDSQEEDSQEEDSQEKDSQEEKSFSLMSTKRRIVEQGLSMVLSLTSLHNGDLVFSTLDEKFKTNKVSFKGHDCYVRTSANLDEQTLISGSNDSTIKFWDLSTGRCIKTLTGHKDGVSYLIAINKELLVSIDYDNSLKIWNLKTGICTKTIKLADYDTASNFLMIGNWMVYSASTTICKFNIVTEELFKSSISDFGKDLPIQKRHKNSLKYRISCLELIPNTSLFVSGSMDSSIDLWSLEPFTFIMRFNIGHTDIVRCIKSFNSTTIVSGSCDGTIKFWNITTGECLQTLINGTHDSVESLEVLPDGSIASGCEDVKIWYPRMLIEPTLKDTLCMAIQMLKDLQVEHYLDATTIIELYQMM
jgi:WD40 repeat protein